MRTTRIVAIAAIALLALVAFPEASALGPPVFAPRPPEIPADVDDAQAALDGAAEDIEEIIG